MHAFRRHARLDASTYKDPGVEDRSGPPLTQGFLFTVIGAVASEDCSADVLDILSKIDPDAWYHGQLLESILERFERKSPILPRRVGRSVYLMMRAQLAANGVTSVRQMLGGIPLLWLQVTRGDGGVWRVELDPGGGRSARLEAEQPTTASSRRARCRASWSVSARGTCRSPTTPACAAGLPFAACG
jgi:hypothetical protein